MSNIKGKSINNAKTTMEAPVPKPIEQKNEIDIGKTVTKCSVQKPIIDSKNIKQNK